MQTDPSLLREPQPRFGLLHPAPSCGWDEEIAQGCCPQPGEHDDPEYNQIQVVRSWVVLFRDGVIVGKLPELLRVATPLREA